MAYHHAHCRPVVQATERRSKTGTAIAISEGLKCLWPPGNKIALFEQLWEAHLVGEHLSDKAEYIDFNDTPVCIERACTVTTHRIANINLILA